MDPVEHRQYDTVTISKRRYNEFIADIEDLKNRVAKAQEEKKEVEDTLKQVQYDKTCLIQDMKVKCNRIKELEEELAFNGL